MKTLTIPQPDNFKVEVNNGKVLSISCDYEGQRYTYTLRETAADILKKSMSAEDAAQHCVNCLAAAFFGASHFYQLSNIMRAFELVGDMTTESINE